MSIHGWEARSRLGSRSYKIAVIKRVTAGKPFLQVYSLRLLILKNVQSLVIPNAVRVTHEKLGYLEGVLF